MKTCIWREDWAGERDRTSSIASVMSVNITLDRQTELATNLGFSRPLVDLSTLEHPIKFKTSILIDRREHVEVEMSVSDVCSRLRYRDGCRRQPWPIFENILWSSLWMRHDWLLGDRGECLGHAGRWPPTSAFRRE